MEIVLNELSLQKLPTSSELASKAMDEIILIINSLKKNTRRNVELRATCLSK